MRNINDLVGRVLQRMGELQIDQAELVRRFGKDRQSTINKLLNKKLSRWPTWTSDLARALETSVQWLETGTKEEKRDITEPKTQQHQSNFEIMAYTLKKLTDDELFMISALLGAEQRSRALSAALPDGKHSHEGKV